MQAATIEIRQKDKPSIWVFHYRDGQPEGVGDAIKAVLEDEKMKLIWTQEEIATELLKLKLWEFELIDGIGDCESYVYLIDCENQKLFYQIYDAEIGILPGIWEEMKIDHWRTHLLRARIKEMEKDLAEIKTKIGEIDNVCDFLKEKILLRQALGKPTEGFSLLGWALEDLFTKVEVVKLQTKLYEWIDAELKSKKEDLEQVMHNDLELSLEILKEEITQKE